jgi:hypothetical protein
MLLRRITEHVKAQNWTAVALDFVIVVVGVFIGIQVANWNAAIAEDRRAHGNLGRIHSDLALDEHLLKLRLEFWAQVYDYGGNALAVAEGRKQREGEAWPLVLAFYQASQVSHFNKVDTTYEELKGAGELALIDDLDLRTKIARYYAGAAQNLFMFSTLPVYRERIRAMTPFDVQNYIWDACHQSGIEEQRLIDCPSPIDETRAEEILAIYLGDEELVNELRFWMAELRMTIGVGESTLSDVRETAQQVAGALK